MIPTVDEAMLRTAVTPAFACAVIREAFRADGEGRTLVPAVINFDIPAVRGDFHIKTAQDTAIASAALQGISI